MSHHPLDGACPIEKDPNEWGPILILNESQTSPSRPHHPHLILCPFALLPIPSSSRIFAGEFSAGPRHHDKSIINDLEHKSLHYDLSSRHKVYIYHPVYEERHSYLFHLYAWDHPEGGLLHVLAHNVCAMIAKNRLDGFLSRSRGDAQLNIALNEILSSENYFFHVSDKLRKADEITRKNAKLR